MTDPQAFADIQSIFCGIERPKRPLWVPRWAFSDIDTERATRLKIDELLRAGTAPAPVKVLASPSLAEVILASRLYDDRFAENVINRFGADPRDPEVSRSWLSFLGIQGDEGP